MIRNRELDEKIKSYESLMHRVLQNYKVKQDYEDLMQEMRIVVWKALINSNPKTMYIENKETKFTTYLYRLMENKLINIFKVEYKIKPERMEEEDKGIENTKDINKSKIWKRIQKEQNATELPFTMKSRRSLAKPKLFEDMSFKQQMSALQNMYDAESIRLKTDIGTFCSTLNSLDQLLWKYSIEGWTHLEVAKKSDVNKSRQTISRRLKTINEKFIKFMKDGEI